MTTKTPEISITTVTCRRCGHTWIPRRLPVRICPSRKCGSTRWDEPREPREKAAQE